jgi:hypothetical protein
MTAVVPLPVRDYSILTPQQLARLKKRSEPPQPDYDAIAEKERRHETHSRLTAVTSTWQNTIASNRLDRQTRLQRAAEAEEQRRVALDGEERKFQKLKRQAKIAEAASIAFSERPEVRAVNAQLLLHEVQLEREQQVLTKERTKVAEMKRQMEFDTEYNRRYHEMLANEERILAERRAKAKKAAEECSRLRIERAAAKRFEREQDMRDGRILAEQVQYELDLEKQAEADARRRDREFALEVKAKNEEMLRYRESQQIIEEVEDQRINRECERVIDEEDERRAADIRRKKERLDKQQRLIDAATKRQMETRAIQQDFLDKQLALQHEKEKAEVTNLNNHRTRLLNERRSDMLESRKLIEERGKVKKERELDSQVFPWNGDEKENKAYEQRRLAMEKSAHDQAEFQRTQAREKREKERTDREREKLEFKHTVEEDEAFLRRAQDYACDLLKKSKEEDDSDLPFYSAY